MSFRHFLRLFLHIKAGSESQYRSALRSAIRGLWTDELDFDQFFEAMLVAIERNITQAWDTGARDCGVLPDEKTRAEQVELRRAIATENQWIDGFGVAIEQNSRASGGKLGPLFNRAEIWIGRWEGVRSKARAMACADRKLKWVVGDTEHCNSCLRLNGKVRRGSFWNGTGILPRVHDSPFLECKGFRCRCELVPTDEPASRGPLPSLP